MTGAQLKKLRQANGLSYLQFAPHLGFIDPDERAKRAIHRTIKKIKKLETRPFIPEPLVYLINRQLAEGKLVLK